MLMNLLMAISAHQFEIIPIKRDILIVHIILIERNNMMYNHTGCITSCL